MTLNRIQTSDAILDSLSDINDNSATIESAVDANAEAIENIQSLISAQASPTNPVMDKDFINSTVGTNTAIFRGTYNSLAELQAQTATNNDYGFVITTDSAGNTLYNRYKYNGTSWIFEYSLNNSSFTAAQWASIQSGITQALVTKLNNIEVPNITYGTTDIGTGASLDTGAMYFVYEA